MTRCRPEPVHGKGSAGTFDETFGDGVRRVPAMSPTVDPVADRSRLRGRSRAPRTQDGTRSRRRFDVGGSGAEVDRGVRVFVVDQLHAFGIGVTMA